MLRNLDFGNEAGDDADAEELSAYFVEQDTFASFLSLKKKLLVATARKGVGKSALLQWIAQRIPEQDSDALVIKVRGADLVRSKFNLTSTLTTPNDYIQDWMCRLCALANRKLAIEQGFAFSDDSISLVETAEIDGYKARNLVGCLVDRMQSLLKEGKTTKIQASNEVELLKRISRTKERNLWIIIDDLDATYQNTDIEALTLATFFSACRYLTQDVKGVYFRVSLRTDIWPLLRRYDEALGKIDQYVSEILWEQGDFLKLLAFRIHASTSDVNGKSELKAFGASTKEMEKALTTAFVPKMLWGEKMVDTYKAIYTLSYERPRWAVQLCKLAQTSALRKGAKQISKETIDSVWGEYGAKRIADVVAEHKHQCPEIEEILNGFRGVERLLTRESLLAWIKNRIGNHIDVSIEGKRTRDPKQIARFLYRVGFIVARSDGEGGAYEHYRFDQMHDLLLSRTNEDFGMKWEIHPCYRQALDIKKIDRSHKERFNRQRTRV
jgi:hypothetical protein